MKTRLNNFDQNLPAILDYVGTKYSGIKNPNHREVLMSGFMKLMFEKLGDDKIDSAEYILIHKTDYSTTSIASKTIEGAEAQKII